MGLLKNILLTWHAHGVLPAIALNLEGKAMHILSLECQCQLASEAQCFHSLQQHEAPLCALKVAAALLYCLIMSALAKKQAILRRNFLVLEVSVMFQQLVCNRCVCFQFGLALWVCWRNWRQVFYWNKIISLNKSALLSLALARFGVNLALYSAGLLKSDALSSQVMWGKGENWHIPRTY